jgi:threonine dehydrogenase-like Zn-dependent dehydrogenase
MRALHFSENGLRLSQIEVPNAEKGEALIRVRMAGICSTDLEIVRGYLNFRGVIGHEFVGTVEDSSNRDLVGKRVVGEINLGCGVCAWCTRKNERHCQQRRVLGILGKDGCFAEFITLPLRNLYRVPDRLEDRIACFVEPVAACYQIIEQLTFMPHDRVAVLGDGKLGILAAQVIAHWVPGTVLVGHHERKLKVAQACGVKIAREDELELKSYDTVVEATGSPGGMEKAIGLVRPQGTIVLKSTYHGDLLFDAAPLVINEIHLIGSRCGPFGPAIAALAGKDLCVEPLIDATYPLDQAEDAFIKAKEPEALKVLIDCK